MKTLRIALILLVASLAMAEAKPKVGDNFHIQDIF